MGRFAIGTGKCAVILPLLSAMVLLSNLIMQDGISFAAAGGWTGNGPEGGQIKALTIDPVTSGNLYAGTSGGGVFRSFDGGNSWSPANSGLTNFYINSVAIDPDTPSTIYSGTYGGGVFKSTNGGSAWSPSNTGLSNNGIFALSIDPTTPTTLYAGTSGGGVFKSTNGGSGWSPANTGLTNTYILSLAIDPTTPSTLFAGTNAGVFISSNSGGSWITSSGGLTNTRVISLAIDPTTSNTIFAGTDGGGVFKSTNGGSSWSPAGSDLANTYVYSLSIDPATPTIIYAGTSGGMFKSTNGGNNWSPLANGLTSPNVMSFAVDPTDPATVYAGTYGGGVFKSTNSGGTRNPAITGLTNTYIHSLAIDPATSTTLYAGTYYNGAFKSSDGGASWNPVNIGLNSTFINSIAIDPATPATLYAGTSDKGVFKSSNGGIAWNPSNTGLTNSYVKILAIDAANPNIIYAGTTGGIFKSNNGGGAWNPAVAGLTNTYVSSLAIDPNDSQTVYAGTWYGVGIFKSVNGGSSWVASNNGLTVSDVSALAIDPATATIYAGTSAGVFKSTNGGGSWSAANNGISGFSIHSLAIDPATPATIYAGTDVGGVYKSTNGGASWNSVINGLTSTHIYSLAIDSVTPTTIHAGTYGGGVYSWTIPTVPPPKPESVVPTPGNGQITIGWSEVADATSYNIYYSTTPGVSKTTGTRISAVTRPGSVSPLINGTPYYFIVTAVNTYGESVESDQVSAVPGVSSAAYTLADLAGNWEVNSLASGPGAPWWIRISLNIAADGSFSGTETDSDGFTGSTSGTLQISPNGIVTMAGNSIFQCSMDSGKTLLACTSTGAGSTSPGTSELILFTKKGSGYSLTDMLGDWWFSNLVTPGPYWERGSLAVASSGAFTYAFIDSDSHSHAGSGTFNITSDGVLTPVGANISPTRCVMDSGKSASVCTSTSVSGDTGLQILTRKAASYALSDLSGTWGVNALVSSPGAPWWNRGSVTFATNGSCSGILQDYDGSPPRNVTGTFGIAANGVFTPDFNANEECHMDAGKTIMACTGTWTTGSPGSTELTVLTKRMASAPATLRGLAITSGPASLYENNAATYAVSAYWSDGSSSSVAPTWSVTPTTYATINSSTGQLTTLAVSSNRTVTVSAVYTGNGITLTASKTVTIVNQTSNLTLTLAGSGSGSVNSNPTGMIACTYPPQSGTCLTSQPASTALTLIATPSNDSSFDSWGSACGSCTGLSCLLNIDSDKTCTAAFRIRPLVRIAGPVYFASIIKAYDQLSEGSPASILAQAVELTENADLNKEIQLTLQGGYDPGFNTRIGFTTLHGGLTVSKGALVVDRLIVR